MSKTPKNAKKYICEICAFVCCKNCDYNRHLATAKHKRLTSPNANSANIVSQFACKCGKIYKHMSSLCNHKTTCSAHQTSPVENTFVEVDTRDVIIDKLVNNNMEMKLYYQSEHLELKTMFKTLLENYHESIIQKQGVVGNTTNIQNNTLNFYLTHTCKDAESIHEFTDRFVARSIEFFKENFRRVATNQVDLAASVYNIMNKCLDEKPQNEKFIQTTDIKNGILYVKEKKKNGQRQFYGEAEFVKHMDGFEKTGTNLEHAINKVFFPMKEEFTELMKYECGSAPHEDNYEDEDELYKYKERVTELKRNMCLQTYNTSTVFDKKYIRDEILARTKRHKDSAALE